MAEEENPGRSSEAAPSIGPGRGRTQVWNRSPSSHRKDSASRARRDGLGDAPQEGKRQAVCMCMSVHAILYTRGPQPAGPHREGTRPPAKLT